MCVYPRNTDTDKKHKAHKDIGGRKKNWKVVTVIQQRMGDRAWKIDEHGGASLRGTGERVMHDRVAQQESKKETETGSES